MDKNINEYKAIIINGTNDKSNDIDGHVDFVGPIGECDYHVDCLLEYARDKYPDVSIFQRITDRCEPDVPIFFLTWLNNVVYINISGNRVGKYGMLFLPDEISEKQLKLIYELAKQIPKAHVDIVYDMDFDDGFVESKEFNYERGKGFEETLNEFLKKVNQKKSK